MKKPTVDDLLKDNEDLRTKYNNIKKEHIIVFIIGVLIGVIGLIFIELNSLNDMCSPTMPNNIRDFKSVGEFISDVENLNVAY
jgi:hypothetical protein